MAGMKIEAVVLAAGYSSRAGAFKMGLEIGGRSVIERCIASLAEVCSRIVVVGGYQSGKLAALIRSCPRAELVINHRYAEGMFTSVKAGVKELDCDRFFLTPGDYPLVGPEVHRQLLASEGGIVIPAYHGRKGHPVLIPGEYARELLAEADTSNLRLFLQRKGFQTVAVADEGILMDVDTPEDYRRAVERFTKGGGRNGW
jgi:molybdenum cofactor cytidylyltransferase